VPRAERGGVVLPSSWKCRALVAGLACLAVAVPGEGVGARRGVEHSPAPDGWTRPADTSAELADRARYARARVSRPVSAGSAPAVRARVAAVARAQRGRPYGWGASGPGAYDCSGLAVHAFRAGGRRLPHSAARQSAMGRPVARRWVRPGDLVYWGGRGRAYHVGVVTRVTGPAGRTRVWITDAPYAGRRVVERHPWPGGRHRFVRLIG
jgi:cell wall-associated NlpC family hydrolase